MHVLLPIKNLNFAKQRLASLLNPMERRAFFHAMLNDVLMVLDQHMLVDDITLVSDDPSTLELSKHYQLNCISQASLGAKGLSAAIETGVSYLGQQNVSDVMILHGDLPLISADEVTALIRLYTSSSKPAVVLTPDRRGIGTNCIISATDTDFKFHYGDNSFEKHRARALLCGIDPIISEQDGISCDIDYPQDLLQFLTQANKSNSIETQRYLREHMIIDRLLDQPAAKMTSVPRPRSATAISSVSTLQQKNYAT